jgi:two-component system response regulator
MPNYGGFDVLTWLRARVEESNIPVIVLTGSIYPEDRKRAMQLGANGYEVKPVDCSEFAAIARSIGLHLPGSITPTQ